MGSGQELGLFFTAGYLPEDGAPLFARLGQLAFFLAGLHQKTQNGRSVDWQPVQTYYQKVLTQLSEEGLVSTAGYKNLFLVD